MRGERKQKLDHMVIKKRRPHLKRIVHARPVDFNQHLVHAIRAQIKVGQRVEPFKIGTLGAPLVYKLFVYNRLLRGALPA